MQLHQWGQRLRIVAEVGWSDELWTQVETEDKVGKDKYIEENKKMSTNQS